MEEKQKWSQWENGTENKTGTEDWLNKPTSLASAKWSTFPAYLNIVCCRCNNFLPDPHISSGNGMVAAGNITCTIVDLGQWGYLSSLGHNELTISSTIC